jgi:hypothetical protein
LAGVAAVMLSVGVVAWAQEVKPYTPNTPNNTPPPPPNPEPTPTPTPAPAAPENENPEAPAAPGAETAPPTEGALMQGLDKVGVGNRMESWGLNVYGYVEGGYLYDLTNAHDLSPAKTAPADDIFFAGPYKNTFDLDQANLTIERLIDPTKGNWDFGFHIEGLYGRDAYFTHSDGILDNNNKEGGLHGPFDQPDLLQAYLDVNIPVGTGLDLRVGKFTDLLGLEQINPTENIFYTHSYAFTYGMPFTETGVLGIYKFTNDETHENVTLTAGTTRGWNQSSLDNNGDPDGVFRIDYNVGSITLDGGIIVGPEGNLPYGPPDNSHWWFVPDVAITWKASDDLTIAANFLYGNAQNPIQWLSAAIYAQYQIDPMFAVTGRAEVYFDKNGITTGIGGGDVDYSEVTVGLPITPFPNTNILNALTIRPEVRADFANVHVLDLTHDSELTGAVDFVMKF